MQESDREKLYNDALKQWGMDFQLNQAVEECAEFIVAVNKLRRSKPSNEVFKIEDLRSEVADVTNCMEQMRMFFGKDAVDNFRQQKLERLDQRIKEADHA